MASPEELRLISGLGPTRIRDILAYRKNHPFRTVEELARIKGIGNKTVRRMRLHLAVSGPSTIQKVIRPNEVEGTQPKNLQNNTTVKTVVPAKVVVRANSNQPAKVVDRSSKLVTGKERSASGVGNHCLPMP